MPVLTGLDDAAIGAAAVAAGAQDYLVKGHIDGTRLSRTIAYAIQRVRAQTAERQLREAGCRHGRTTGCSAVC